MRTVCTIALCVALLPVVASAEVTVEAEHYDITAPDRKTADAARTRLEWSAWLFEDLFGAAPPRGKVILEKAPADAQDLDLGPGASGKAVVSSRRVDPNSPQEEGWTLPWFAGNLSTGGRSSSLAREGTALTHEAAHLQFAEATHDRATGKMKEDFNGYGGYLPDWFDEAVAVYHELDATKAQRREQFLQIRRSDLIPLSDLFTMSHPAVAGGGAGGSGRIEIAVPADIDPEQFERLIEQHKKQALAQAQKNLKNAGGPEKINTFYIQSLAVIEYMVARGRRPFVRYAADLQARGKSMDDVLTGWQEKHKEIARLRPAAERGAARTAAPAKRAGALPAHRPAIEIAGVLVRPKERVAAMPMNVKAMHQDWLQWLVRSYRRHTPRLPKSPTH